MTKVEEQLAKLDGLVAMLKSQMDTGLHILEEASDRVTHQIDKLQTILAESDLTPGQVFDVLYPYRLFRIELDRYNLDWQLMAIKG